MSICAIAAPAGSETGKLIGGAVYVSKAEDLIGMGYLPKELPIEFTSTPLSREYLAVDGASTKSPKWAEAEMFSLARGGHARRVLRIPNPLHYIRQAQLIDTHWADIESVIKLSPISLARPSLGGARPGQSRATTLRPERDLAKARLSSLASGRYVLQTDFARFYPSIYTHSIPWALHTKQAAKANFHTPRAQQVHLFGDDIDSAIRAAQSGQTIGIPVGPDLSYVVSEAIASRIDSIAFPGPQNGFRYIDDYFISFDTEIDAQNALDALTAAARTYEIDLNYQKTSIQRVEDVLDGTGLQALSDFGFQKRHNVSEKELNRFFGIAMNLSRSNENALRYAIRILAEKKFDIASWDVLESYLLRAGVLSPNCLDVVAFMLFRYRRLGAGLDEARLSRYFANIVVNAIRHEYHSDGAWALWAFKALQLTVPERVTDVLSKTNNSIVALLALDLRDRGLLAGTRDAVPWIGLLHENELYGEHWLLVYESIVKGWLVPPRPVLSTDARFSEMQTRGVYFYESNRLDEVAHQLATMPIKLARTLPYGQIKWFLAGIDEQIATGAVTTASESAPTDAPSDTVAGADRGETDKGESFLNSGGHDGYETSAHLQRGDDEDEDEDGAIYDELYP